MTRLIISIQGPQAVGKTTILRRLQPSLPLIHFDFEDPYPTVAKRNRLGLDLNTKAGFIENQRLFIEAECVRYNSLPEGRVIMDRGPEDTECYTLTHPKRLGKDWDIELEMAEDLAKLRECRSQHILYLHASPQTLLRRKEGDTTRRRSGFDLHAFSIEEAWFRSQSQVEFMDVDNKTLDDVVSMVADWLRQRCMGQSNSPT